MPMLKFTKKAPIIGAIKSLDSGVATTIPPGVGAVQDYGFTLTDQIKVGQIYQITIKFNAFASPLLLAALKHMAKGIVSDAEVVELMTQRLELLIPIQHTT